MTTTPRPKLFLVDGSGYIFRAYYAIRPLSTRDGLPTNAVLGVAKMFAKLLREQKPDLLAIAFDAKTKTFRHQTYAAYKANRDAPPEDLVPQFALIHELVAAMDLPSLVVEGFEADDILATLAHQGVQQAMEVVLVSGDKDLMQVVGPHVTMYDPVKDCVYDAAGVVDKLGVPPHLVADAQALSGDSSDNIPGVPKVGAKSAAKLVHAHGDIERVIEALRGQEKLRAFERSVLDHAESARLSKKLTVLRLDVPVSLRPEDLTCRWPDPAKLAPFLRKIEAFALLREFAAGAENPPTDAQPATLSAPVLAPEDALHGGVAIDRGAYRMLLNLDDLDAFVEGCRRTKRVSVDLETTSREPTQADIVGIALCVPTVGAGYIPLRHHYLGVPRQLPLQEVLGKLREILEDPTIGKVGQNLKYDYIVFRRYGITLAPIVDDAMLAAYVLDPARPSFALDALSRDVLGHHTITYADVAGKGKAQVGFAEVPIDRATAYAAEDADVALRVADALGERVRTSGLGGVYNRIELRLLPVLAEMERAGILVDAAVLQRTGRELNERLERVEKKAHELIGTSAKAVNLASPKQLARLFFEDLGYPVIKKTKTGYSTDQEVLEALARDHELPGVILEHRLLAKLKSTYVDALPKMINPRSKRVHTSFNQTGAATGRLSSSDPNLQNIPIRSPDGRRIREAFVAAEGCVLISADYSQIELRVLAHLCRDPSFVAAFNDGEDIHRRTAQEVLAGGQEPTAAQRRRAKAINFGILYGQSEFGLAKQLGIARAVARDYIGVYFSRYPTIRTFFSDVFAQARRVGYVETIFGRRRFLPDLNSKNKNRRQAAERVAMNTPIQGSAADLIKLAMINVHARLQASQPLARLLLQVHDELLIEAPLAAREEVVNLVRKEMSEVHKLAVPLVVDVGYGPNWAAAH